MKKAFIFIGLAIVSTSIFAQNNADVVTVLSYNILNYRNNFAQCNSSTNPVQEKEANLAIINKHVDPDIVCYQEVSSSGVFVTANLLSNTLNVDGETKYAAANTGSNSNLQNAVFFNSDIFSVYSTDAIDRELGGGSIIRQIDVVTFYHNDPSLSVTLDTTFLTVFVAHLKAGNSSSDETERARATAAIMNYLDEHPELENYLLAGDLNVYDGNGDAFSNLTSGGNRFHDPLNAIGDWSNSSSFSYLHTQSTRSNSTNGGCFSGGGMDDRFDFILMSDAIRTGSKRIEFTPGFYEALGQDGNRFNGDIRFNNTSEPAEVIDALYEVSDHLPIVMPILVNYSAPVGISESSQLSSIKVEQNVNTISIVNLSNQPFTGSLRIVDLMGRIHFETQSTRINASGKLTPNTTLENGLYILQLIDDSQSVVTTTRFYKN